MLCGSLTRSSRIPDKLSPFFGHTEEPFVVSLLVATGPARKSRVRAGTQTPNWF
jgi:hypothetical protein